MMVFVVISVYVIYILSLNYSGTNFPKRKTTVQSRQKLKRLEVRLSGYFFFKKNISNKDLSFLQVVRRRTKGGSVSAMNR